MLLPAAGACYIRGSEAPAKLILRDVVEMCKGVQHPTRGLFLRAYLVQARDGMRAVTPPPTPLPLAACGQRRARAVVVAGGCCPAELLSWTVPQLTPRHLHTYTQVMRGLLPDTGSQYESEGGQGGRDSWGAVCRPGAGWVRVAGWRLGGTGGTRL